MLRLAVLSALILLVLPSARAETEAAARFRELRVEYEGVRKSVAWPDVKRRRELIRDIADLELPATVPLLYDAFLNDREQICRVPALIGLGRIAPLKVVKSVLFHAIGERSDLFVRLLPRALERNEDPGLGPWLIEGFLGRRGDPVLRASVVETLGRMQCRDGFVPLLRILGKGEDEVRILYECLLATARIGGPEAYGAASSYLHHQDPVLREGAVLALAETAHPLAAQAVLELAEDPDPRVQEAVAEAVARLGDRRAVGALIRMLRCGRLRVMDSARQALETLTGEDLGVDAEAWEAWCRNRDRPPKPPAGDEVATIATYYGLKVLSDRVLFVVDISGSMETGDPSRIDLARRELKRTLGQLSPRTLFNVVAFGGSPMWWEDSEVPATPKNLRRAQDFVGRMSAGGYTNVYDTLEQAFSRNRLIDTIFFLGDGIPSKGKFVEPEEILARVRWMNRFRKVRIHTIAFLRTQTGDPGGRGPATKRTLDDGEAARFMSRLAGENRGSFLLLDR